MAASARVGDPSAHGGAIAGPGVESVQIGGLPAAVAGDLHTCPLSWGPVPHGSTPFPTGSATVLMGGRPALRTGDLSSCGAPVAGGAPNVLIGG